MLGSIIGAGIMSAGSLLGQYYQAKAQQKINEQNLKFQDEANRLSIDLANSAHQREVADLRAAGLNPILSAGGNGASTPQIGAITAENPYNGLAASASSVSRELARLFDEKEDLAMDQTIAQTENIRAQKRAIESDAELKSVMADVIRKGRDFADSGIRYLKPAARSFGEILGNTAASFKEEIDMSKEAQRRIYYPPNGRYVDMYWLIDHDPDYLDEYLRHNKRK